MPNKYDAVVKRIYRDSRPLRPPLTEEQLVDFESWLGYGLPADYREFLRDYGGILAHSVYPLKDSRREIGRGGVFNFFDMEPVETREQLRLSDNTIELDATPTMWEVLDLDADATEVGDPPRELLAIAIDQGGNQVYLSLGGKQPGAIYLWMNWEDIYFVADSFDEFMQSLEARD